MNALGAENALAGAAKDGKSRASMRTRRDQLPDSVDSNRKLVHLAEIIRAPTNNWPDDTVDATLWTFMDHTTQKPRIVVWWSNSIILVMIQADEPCTCNSNSSRWGQHEIFPNEDKRKPLRRKGNGYALDEGKSK